MTDEVNGWAWTAFYTDDVTKVALFHFHVVNVNLA